MDQDVRTTSVVEPSSHSVLSLRLKTRPFQEHIIEKRFEVARRLYNSLLGIELKKYQALKRTEEYRTIQSEIDAVLDEYSEETQEEINPGEDTPEIRRKLRPECRTDPRYKDAVKKRSIFLRDHGYMGGYSFQKDLAPLKNYYETRIVDGKKKNNPKIGSQVLNELAINAWTAMSGHIYKGLKVNFIRKGELNSLSSTNPNTPMILRDGIFSWHGFSCPVIIDPKDMYAAEMLQKEPAFYRVVRKTENRKNNYYLQIVLKGAPVRKLHTQTGNFKHAISPDAIGVDIGLSCVAVVSDTKVALFLLAPHAQPTGEKKEELQAFLSRSRFENNPHRFHANGTIRRLTRNSKDRYWVVSKAYHRTRAEIREMDRYNAAVRKDDHGYLANYILSLGSKITMEKINFRSLAKRAEETETTPSGRIKSKKRGGKSITNRAPAMLVAKLEQKTRDYAGKPIRFVDPKLTKASKYDHTAKKYLEKRPFEGSFTILSNGDRVQTHLYNAFLLTCVDCDTINQESCQKKYAAFKKLHDQEMARSSET